MLFIDPDSGLFSGLRSVDRFFAAGMDTLREVCDTKTRKGAGIWMRERPVRILPCCAGPEE